MKIHTPCEHLARIGLDWLGRHLGRDQTVWLPGEIDEEPAPASYEWVYDALTGTDPSPVQNRAGVQWIIPITWPDRVPQLAIWSGQQALAKIIAKNQRAIQGRERRSGRRLETFARATDTHDPCTFTAPLHGASGLDIQSCPRSIDVGFSPAALDMAVWQRPALELLAILGVEIVPLVSLAVNEYGYIHEGRLWRFPIVARDGGYYHAWGPLHGSEDLDEVTSR
jgi:hypothetical protein